MDVSALAKLICDRTLAPFTQKVSGDYSVLFAKRPIEQADTDEAIRPLDPTTRDLDLTDEIRDTLLLSVPLRKVAPDARNAELVLSYGTKDESGTAIDPRWEALRKLKKSG
jgi:uncharacterized protein